MKLTKHQIAQIHHLSVIEGWSNYALSQKFDVHHSTIARALRSASLMATSPAETPQGVKAPGMIEPFMPQIERMLTDYKRMPATRILELLRAKGFEGSVNTVRRAVRFLKQSEIKRPRTFIKREVFAGNEAQVDWAELGKVRFADNEQKVYLLVIVLSWSRDIYAHAFTDMQGPTLCRGHVYAFKHFGGIPRFCLYDNMKTVVLKTECKLARYNEDFLSFATDYRFRLKNCNPRQPQEKGRVERAIRYLRDSFFPARDFLDLADLNRQLHLWLTGVSRQRRWPDGKKFTVAQQVIKERSHLSPLPAKLWLPKGRVLCRVHKIPYVVFQTCKYSTPPALVGRSVAVHYDDEGVEIWADGKIHAIHERSYGRGEYVECKEHVLEMAKYHGRGCPSTKQSAIMRMVPQSRNLLEKLRSKGQSTAQPVRVLFELLEAYGGERLGSAIDQFTQSGSTHLDSLERILKNEPPKVDSAVIPPHLLPASIKATTTIHQDLGQYS